jgi:CDGSH-type Zn-finger protein
MGEPKIADTRPAVIELAAGSYFWCACGESKNQPYCDGSHKGGEFVPVKLELPEAKRVALCNCKRTGNQPFCDGTHKNLS